MARRNGPARPEVESSHCGLVHGQCLAYLWLQGEVYTWGLNTKAQMGMPSGPGDASHIPKRMELLVGWDVK